MIVSSLIRRHSRNQLGGLAIRLFFAFFTFLVATSGQAQMTCSEVYQKDLALELEQALANGPMMGFESSKLFMMEARKHSEANEAIHSLAVEANRMFDYVVELIMQVNFAKLPKDVQSVKAVEAEQLIENLQQTFSIGNNQMQAGIQNRVQAEIAAIEARNEAMTTRRAIGFGRDQSSLEFHKDAPGQQHPIGFGRRNESLEEARMAEKGPLGFTAREPAKTEELIHEIVEGTELPMGFTPLTARSEAPSRPEPIGFVRPRKESDTIVESKLHQILFDIEYGVFEFVKTQP